MGKKGLAEEVVATKRKFDKSIILSLPFKSKFCLVSKIFTSSLIKSGLVIWSISLKRILRPPFEWRPSSLYFFPLLQILLIFSLKDWRVTSRSLKSMTFLFLINDQTYLNSLCSSNNFSLNFAPQNKRGWKTLLSSSPKTHSFTFCSNK